MLGRRALLLFVISLSGCGEPACPDAGECDPVDSAIDASAATDAGAMLCAADRDCSDGDFCSGPERCVPGDSAADARGCVAGAPPCLADQVCDSDMGRCVTDCSVGDADGDGEPAIECGGNDCDDADGGRFPGNIEICDDRDQDCVDDTLAPASGDSDGDGFVSSMCCAPGMDGLRCGRDCDDTAGGVNPGSPEACNGIDDDCDGLTDEGLTSVFYRDEDGDLYGMESDSMVACTRPEGFATVPGDCDDEDRMINPLGTETCDGVDQDCDSRMDEEAAELGSRVHCDACFSECQFACGGDACDLPVEVEVGGQQACVRLSSGRVFCWGQNDSGQLGLGDTLDRERPTELPESPRAAAMGLGGDHSCFAIGSDIRCAGDNSEEQLRLGPAASSTLIRSSTAPSGSSFLDVSAGQATTCSMLSGGRTTCWGRAFHTGGSLNYLVEEGDGSRLLADSVHVGTSFACALRSDDTVGCWGADDVAQLATGSAGAASLRIVGNVLPESVAHVAAGAGLQNGGGAHGCLVTTGGQLTCWGLNRDGQVGVGSSDTTVPVPTTIPGEWAGVATGDRTTCAWDTDGRGFCWGRNNGHIGDGTAVDRDVPTAVLGGHRWSQLEVGSDVTCGIRADDAVMCWGINGNGTVGNDTFGGREAEPVMVVSPVP
ncbi:MAG: MopE-related protein [Sandaracinaceae bacterium]